MRPAQDPLVPTCGRFDRGYPQHSEGQAAEYGPLSCVLVDRFPDDRHFAAYSRPDVPRRLATDAALSMPGGVPMALLVADVEPQGHAPVTSSWWDGERRKIDRILLRRPGGLVYRTRGGYRLVYRLAEPIVLSSKADRESWRARYLVWLAQLAEDGVAADRACADWTRLYRLPRVLRDGVPQDPEYVGDPTSVGAWPLPAASPRRPGLGSGLAARVAAHRGPIRARPEVGRRNEELFRHGCLLRRRGSTEEDILGALLLRNSRLDEPLDDSEVESVARSACRYDPDPELMEAARRAEDGGLEDAPELEVGDHVEVALLELDRLGPTDMVVCDRGAVRAYDAPTGVWQVVPAAELRRRAQLYSGCEVQPRGLTKAGEPRAPVVLKVSHSFTVGVAAAVADRCLRDGFFDAGPLGVAFRDAFYEVGDGGVLYRCDHHPDNRALTRYEWDFQERPRTPLWDRFLADLGLGDGVARYLHEYLGACLLGDVTRYRTCVALLGEGANGKSTFLDVAQACFPPGSVASVSPREWGRRFVLADLAAALVNVVDEFPAQRVEHSDVFKEVVSGGRVRAERKYEGAFEFRPRCGHLFAANELPRSLDRTDGFFARWAIVPFARQFAPGEQDHRLRERLLAELPGISSVLLLAACDLVRRGRLDPPPAVTSARDDWRARSDHALRFARGLAADPEARADTEELYRAFVRWLQHDERAPADEVPSKDSFGRAMRRAGHEPAPFNGKSRGWRVKFNPLGVGLQ